MAEPRLQAVLVADGEPLIRQMVSSLLGRRGYVVCEAAGSAEALDCLARHPDIALLITDTELAGSDGWSLARAAVAADPQLRVIYTSAVGNSAPMDQGPAGRFLAKPYSLARLVIAVADALRD